MTADGDDGRLAARAVVDDTADALYEQAPCGYVSTFPDGTIVRANRTFLDWLGHGDHALVRDRKFQSLLTIGSQIYYETHYAPLLRMQGFANEIALELVAADKRVIPVLLNSRLRRSVDGTPLAVWITLFDATDRRRYERELLLARRKAEQVAKDKADLLAMLSHDIRNPLHALMGVVHLLERGGVPEAQRPSLRIVRSSVESMLALLDRVLDLSRVESNSFALAETAFSLRDVVARALATFDAPARAKGLDLRASIDERVPETLTGDPVAVGQILANLVGNAVKFTERGAVTVGIETRERAADAVTLRFEVADTGIGIAPDAVDRIFQPFTQATYETTEKFGGSGLGLAITRRLLALYGSRIDVTTAPGRGSRFVFDLRLLVPVTPAVRSP